MARPIRVLICAALVGIAAASLALAGTPGDAKSALRCVGPLDGPGIDAILSDGGSPLAGEGSTFVSASAAVGIDPRALVAIGAHESVLLTYAPAAAIHNPFGIGPNRRYPDDASAIAAAADLLATHYLGEGRLTIAQISGKWAPIGVANDPTNLNANWTGGVSSLYARLGGDPDAPITLAAQIATTCDGSDPGTARGAASAPRVPAGAPDPDAIIWDGLEPQPLGPGMAGGHDPVSGDMATIDRFAFPVIPHGADVIVANTFAEPAGADAPGCYHLPARCVVELRGTGGLAALAAIDGVLVTADEADQRRGIAFWIDGGGRDRIGYGGLAAYAPGIADGTAVAAGQVLGTAADALAVAWTRNGHLVNAAPMLAATRYSLR